MYMSLKIRPLLISALIILMSCATAKDNYVAKYNDNLHDMLEYRKKKPDVIAPYKTLPKVCMGVAIYSKDLPIKLLPHLLSKVYNVEINLSQTTDLKISFNHSNVCLEDLLSELTELYNVGFSKSSNGYNMQVNNLRTQFFNLNYHNFTRLTNSATTIQGNVATSGSSSSSSSTETNGSSASPSGVGGGFINIETKLDDKFWDNVSSTITSLISFDATDGKSSGSSFSINRENGVIIVHSYPKILKSIEKFINKVNKSCSKQIVIEAKILEIALNNQFFSGINWSMLQGDFQIKPGDFINSSQIPASLFTINAHGKNYFDATIQALETQGKVSILSSPRVSVLNNQRAIIKFGEDGYYLTNISSNIETSGSASSGNVSNSSVTLTPIFSGIALDTSPNIVNDHEVILHIHPTITTVTEQNKSLTVSGQTTVLPLPVISTREADTIVKAASGDIVIIGGLMQNDVKMNKSGPKTQNSFLNKFFGLFASRKDSITKSELIIMLRPIIVNSSESAIFDEQLRDDYFDDYIADKADY